MADSMNETMLPRWSERVDVFDPGELDTSSTMTRRFTRDMGMYRYMLLDRSLLRQSFQEPIARHLTHDLGDVMVCKVDERFAIRLDIGGPGVDSFCFSRMTAGRMTLTQDGYEVACHGSNGLALRASPGTRTVADDGSGRCNVWISAPLLETTLEHLTGDRLRRPLRFRPDVAWDRGTAASVADLFRFLETVAGRPDGLAGNPVALASFRDTLARTVLLGLPHSHSDRLSPGFGGGAPAYVRRADGFMRAHAAEPIGMADVAAAAGCSVRTLEAAYRRFRDTTPLAALHGIRLDQVQAELRADTAGTSAATIARRYGFTNRQRFRRAYERRFGMPPSRVG